MYFTYTIKKLKAVKRKVIIMIAYREFRKLRWNGDACGETSLGAAYGSEFYGLVML
jgi:hypothetical protein